MKTGTIDFTKGHMLKNFMIFVIPLIITGLLQTLFNAADLIVVGRFAGENSLAAVGSTTSLINLIVGLAIGLSVGANVVAAIFIGGKNARKRRSISYWNLWSAKINVIASSTITGTQSAPEYYMNGLFSFSKDNVVGSP